ncbi:MAG: signal recognition particle-docking protein FtsY, partial [Thermodesulfobacteriota bacterium]
MSDIEKEHKKRGFFGRLFRRGPADEQDASGKPPAEAPAESEAQLPAEPETKTAEQPAAGREPQR